MSENMMNTIKVERTWFDNDGTKHYEEVIFAGEVGGGGGLEGTVDVMTWVLNHFAGALAEAHEQIDSVLMSDLDADVPAVRSNRGTVITS